MNVRLIRDNDIPALRQMHKQSGLDYEFPDLGKNFELCMVCCDEQDRPMAAVLMEKIPQLYLICGQFEHPATSKEIIRLMHQAMIPRVKALGYGTVDAFLPPCMAVSFGRRLMRHFGWVRNWPSFCLKL